MKIHNLQGRSKAGYTTWGCTWERGNLSKDSQYLLEDGAGNKIPMQSRITAWWPDGSVKWTAHTADAALMGEHAKVKGICCGSKGQKGNSATAMERIQVCLKETAAGWQV